MTIIRQNAQPFSGRPSFDLIFTVRRFDDSGNNRTTVNLTLDIRSNGGLGTFQQGSGSLGISTSVQSFGQNWDIDFRANPPNPQGLPAGTVRRIAERDVIVNHNSAGAASITTSASASANIFGSASHGSVTSGLTTYPRAPSAPSFVNAQAPVARSIAVSWGASSGGAGVTYYEVERRESTNGGASFGGWGRILYTTAINNRTVTSDNLNPRSTYQFRVRGGGSGGVSGFTNSSLRTIAPAATPPATTAERTLRTVEVTMTQPSVIDNTTNIISYTTERRQNNGNWGDQKTTTDLNNRSITYTDLPSETNQQFRGRANTNRGSSNFSESQTLFIPGLPDAPSQVFALREGASVRVIAAAPISDGGAPVLTYTIEKRISDNFGATWSAWGEPVTITFAESFYLYQNLELQKTYQFRALATNEEGDSEQFTESNTVYLPAIMRIYDDGQFRPPGDYKRYNEVAGSWVGLSISRRYFNGQWIDLE